MTIYTCASSSSPALTKLLISLVRSGRGRIRLTR